MRINQIAIGERFDYEGQTYVKTGPITAASEAGGSRMIPRHAVLAPAGSTPPAAPVQLPRAAVLDAFAQFFAAAQRAAPPAAHAELEEARQKFLDSLG